MEGEADFESRKLVEKYTTEVNQVNEESLKIKNQIITLKKKKDTFYIQTDSLKEINKEQVCLSEQGDPATGRQHKGTNRDH